MIIKAYQGITYIISIHVIMFMSIYLSFYEKMTTISKCFNLGLNMMK